MPLVVALYNAVDSCRPDGYPFLLSPGCANGAVVAVPYQTRQEIPPMKRITVAASLIAFAACSPAEKAPEAAPAAAAPAAAAPAADTAKKADSTAKAAAPAAAPAVEAKKDAKKP